MQNQNRPILPTHQMQTQQLQHQQPLQQQQQQQPPPTSQQQASQPPPPTRAQQAVGPAYPSQNYPPLMGYASPPINQFGAYPPINNYPPQPYGFGPYQFQSNLAPWTQNNFPRAAQPQPQKTQKPYTKRPRNPAKLTDPSGQPLVLEKVPTAQETPNSQEVPTQSTTKNDSASVTSFPAFASASLLHNTDEAKLKSDDSNKENSGGSEPSDDCKKENHDASRSLKQSEETTKSDTNEDVDKSEEPQGSKKSDDEPEEISKSSEIDSPAKSVDPEQQTKKLDEPEKSDENDRNETSDITDDSNQSDERASLIYKPGQYDPKTKRGKKKYDKEFLMAISKIVSKEIISSTDPLYNMNVPLKDSLDRFAVSWQKNQIMDPLLNDPSRRQNQSNYGGRSSDRPERQKKIIPTSSLGHEVELKPSSNPWKPSKVVNEDVKVDEKVADIENLKKKFRSILNKLTPDNFANLAEQVTKLNIDTEDKLGDVIDIVFAKALSEPGYSVLYGRMCSHLKTISAGKAEFGTTLLKRCQNQFQADIYSGLDLEGRKKAIEEEQDPEKKKHMEEELYEEMYRCRMRGLGLIKFIGELYKIDMLNDTIMFYCIERLFYDITDDSIECLCDLLVTIGEKLDKSSKENEKQSARQKSQGPPKQVAYQGKTAAAALKQGPAQSQQQQQEATTLDPIFEKLQNVRKDNSNALSLRIRFKLLDLCELRDKDNWQSKKTKDNNPKTINEIRDAHMEKLEMEKRQNAAMNPRRSQENRRGLGHASGSSSQISSLSNDHGGNRGGLHMSASSQSIRDHHMNDMRTNEEAKKNFETNKFFLKKLASRATSGSDGPETSSLRPTSLRNPNQKS